MNKQRKCSAKRCLPNLALRIVAKFSNFKSMIRTGVKRLEQVWDLGTKAKRVVVINFMNQLDWVKGCPDS